MTKSTYKDAGVDIETKSRFTRDIYGQMRKTFGPRVIENPGGFAGLFSLNCNSREYEQPVLIASTDGVGTKLKIAFMMDRHNTIGIDLVAMCVNDLLVLGGEPLFFLDYLASSSLVPEKLKEVVEGIATGCCESGCSLIGGETPELPGFYNPGEYDLAGFAVGVVEKKRIIKGDKILPGDVVIGLRSSGLHSNGFSLVRKVLFEKANLDIHSEIDQIRGNVGDELLVPTKIYVQPIMSLLRQYKMKRVVKGMAHITGGGLLGNIPRILPSGCSVQIHKGGWPAHRIFSVIQEMGEVAEHEMYRVFNMGIGFVLIVSKSFSSSVLKNLQKMKEEAFVIGEVVKGDGRVEIV
ncbi:MAG: phosphoribosylformylglycinamidine cyclo-ligase [Candidatus Scalindua sp. AMX11]|nr:MAG: phosphoribosylformylglycinamidine cyclo-ligase [Candidatus Scalindua sp.]NOG83573.1 phosphoribosylformylglycinamidine cyclo-ligase [Planctomycetota bacterium]RZV70925.1 MAG: phosphoribosylformylglycinamidine cyclo-ligase [Candidatus Scalindua sp. SCAELEC01]TDE64231.1 MAG: phosphoribosylformylglycinamidine cyclo-ligase [Candidatus Scalindua sp. AMX11]GJQ59976.1 MAG: phosphoribosylformylglycinamidine cyclo-ligase [Candidatus Scalindua sp.]